MAKFSRQRRTAKRNRGGDILSSGLAHGVRPLNSPYDDIVALSPAAIINLAYPRYAGHPVLFQDAACTIPVTSIGDPIGGVRSIVDGSIVATQTTDSARPTWGGEDVGAIWTSGDFLLHEPAITVAADQSITELMAATFSGTENYERPLGNVNLSTSGALRFFQRYLTGGDRIFYEDDAGAQCDFRANVIDNDTAGSAKFVVVYNRDRSRGELWSHGALVDSQPQALGAITMDGGTKIGSNVVGVEFAGEIEYWAYWVGDPLPDSDLMALTEAV